MTTQELYVASEIERAFKRSEQARRFEQKARDLEIERARKAKLALAASQAYSVCDLLESFEYDEYEALQIREAIERDLNAHNI